MLGAGWRHPSTTSVVFFYSIAEAHRSAIFLLALGFGVKEKLPPAELNSFKR
jgi:hypothetical protein